MNKCIFLGRITKDIELTFAQGNGTAIARFSLAVPRKFKKGETDFINVIAFSKTAENIAKYFNKGSLILLETHVQTGSYDAKDGTKRYTTDFIVDNFDFAGGNNTNTEGSNTQNAPNSNDLSTDDLMPVEDGDMPF